MSTTRLDNAYNHVRQELCDVGLLADGVYLDEIPLYAINKWVSWAALFGPAEGFVYDRGIGFYQSLFGFEEGAIYIPSHVPSNGRPYLDDIIRHEYAHAWAWLDPEFLSESWFSDAFGREYFSGDWPAGQKLFKVLNANIEEFHRLRLDHDFVSAYALTSPCEDFAESFYHYLQDPGGISEYRQRKGVYRKLKGIDKAVKRKAKVLGLG